MSISGDGTKDNPYIVDTWDDLKSECAKTKDAYIKIADNQEWDMNKIAPEGDSLTFGGAHVLDCNFAKIKEWHCKGGMFAAKDYDRIDVINLVLERFYLTKGTMRYGLFTSMRSNSFFYFKFKNCILSGIIDSTKFTDNEVYFENSSLNLIATGDVYGFGSCHFEHTDCTVDIEGKRNTARDYFYMVNSALYGKGTIYEILKNSQNSIIDFEASSATNSELALNNSQNIIINSDKYKGATVEQSGSNIIRLTTEQLFDANAIIATGFPIGVE